MPPLSSSTPGFLFIEHVYRLTIESAQGRKWTTEELGRNDEMKNRGGVSIIYFLVAGVDKAEEDHCTERRRSDETT